MLKQYLETGKIVGTHGIKGMVRVQSWADSPDFFKQLSFIYLNNNGTEKLELQTSSAHGNVVLIKLKNIDTIEKAESLRNKIIYFNRNDIKIAKDRYFIQDLIGCNVTDADSNKDLGKITDVSETGANDVWHITKNNKEYLIPAIDDVIVSVDVNTSSVLIRPLKGIFDDED